MLRESTPRLSAAVLALVALAGLGGCKHIATEKEKMVASNHYDLGVLSQQSGDIQGALREYEQALELDDAFPEAHNALAMILHLSYQKDEDAIRHYKRALELRPAFTEVKVNLANVYLSEDRYDPAIKLYTEALNDMLYTTPYIAQGNLGWALYRKGDVRRGVDNIRSAVLTNPKFCQGYRNLGLIYEEQGNAQGSCDEFLHYQEACPGVAEAQSRAAVCLAKKGDVEGAKKAFGACVEKAADASTKDGCRHHLEQLTQMHPTAATP